MPVRLKPYLRRLYLVAFVAFLLNKVVVRPYLLARDTPSFVQTFVLSLPNFLEALFGVGVVTGLLLWARAWLRPRFDAVPDGVVHGGALAIALTYVLTQEFRIHDLGGRNVYDPADAVASVVGCVAMCSVLWRFGVFVWERDGRGS